MADTAQTYMSSADAPSGTADFCVHLVGENPQLTHFSPLAKMRAMKTMVLVFALSISSLALAASGFTRFPFAQRATQSDVVIKWAAPSGATVTYGPKGGATMTAMENSTSTNRHELKLTGLMASTRYSYTVDRGSGDTASGEFSTAASAGEAFSFIVYGDNRTNDSDHQTVVNAIKKEGVDFLIETGDVTEFAIASYYDTYFGIEKDLLAMNVLFPTLGNHEYSSGTGTTLWKQQFYTPDGTYYSFDWGNARFVVMDFNSNSTQQATWADGVMKDARSKGIEHIFAVMHHSPYDSGNHGANTTAQTDWVPVFQKYNIDMILAGHDHDYERGLNSTTNLRYIVTGGGGAPIYTDNSMQSYQQKFEATLNYVKVSIAGPMVTVAAFHTDGSPLDSFSYSTAATAPDMGTTTGSTTGTTGSTTGSTGSTTGTTGSTTGTTGSTTGTTGSTTGTTGSTTGSTGGTTGGSDTSSTGSTGNGAMGSNASGGCTVGGSAPVSFGLLFAFALVGLARRRRS
jgi:hypothetical protein